MKTKDTKKVFIRWGNLELVIRGPYEYCPDLGDFTDAAKVLDWILQIANKQWCSPEILKELLTVLEEASQKRFGSNLQGVFCPWGKFGNVANWKTGKVTRPCKS